jgi:hypothetical protein
MKKIIAVIILGGLAAGVFGQSLNDDPVSLDRAISNSMAYLIARLDEGTRAAVVNFAAPPAVSHYAIEEALAILVNDGKLIVVDRSELELLQQEIDFQISGEVSDESAQSIGKKLGAQTVISGSFVQLGNVWRMRVKALEVETARIQGITTYTVKNDALLSSLLPKQTKTAGEKIGTGALNIVFGLGSYLEGDIAGGITISAGYAAAAGLFVVEAAALDWNNPAVGVPAAIGVSAAGLTLVYGFVRPFIYNRSPKLAVFLDKLKLDAASAPDSGTTRNFPNNLRLSYSFNW